MDKNGKPAKASLRCQSETNQLLELYIPVTLKQSYCEEGCIAFKVPGIFQYEHHTGPLNLGELQRRCGDYGHSKQPCRT